MPYHGGVVQKSELSTTVFRHSPMFSFALIATMAQNINDPAIPSSSGINLHG